MKISLIGDFSFPDEARKVIAKNLLKELSKNNDVRSHNINEILSVNFWYEINSFRPDIIQYIPGASTLCFLVTKLLKIRFKNTKTIIFSSLPTFNNFSHGLYYSFSSMGKDIIPFIKSDLVLVQSTEQEKKFKELGCDVKFFPFSGVDIQKFSPPSKKRKEELRKEYKIPTEKFVVLHVGSVRRWRNVRFLKDIQENSLQVILVGRSSTKFEKDIATELENAGVKIFNEYNPRIEDFYYLSDCYVFPTINQIGSIDIPLSVLEAMACNLPVITTNFGGLSRIFKEGDGLIFDIPENFLYRIKDLQQNNINIKTRESVLYYSWENIAKNLETLYLNLLKGQ